MLVKAWVKLNGGIWAYRDRLRRTSNGPLLRIRRFVYSNYLESLGSYIGAAAEFASEPRFPHKPVGIFIAPEAIIGANATIYQQVTIGLNDDPESRGFGTPTIGDDVFIGAGAKIIGNVAIGSGARIGAGAIVVTDIPAGATAISAAARIHIAPEKR
jgi:serine O-acetyltransferase